MRHVKQFLISLFAPLFFALYELCENKFTKNINVLRDAKQGFFNQIKAEYAAADQAAAAQGAKPPGMPLLTESALRLEQFVTTTTTLYNFGVLTNDVTPGATAVNPTEVRLQTNDNFHIRSIAFYLAVTAASTDTAFRLLTYPNEIALVTVAATLNYMNIYNGTLNINVNQVDVLTKYRISQHYFVPQTQRLAATVNTNYDQADLQCDSVVPMAPGLMLSGAYTNTITLSIPGAVSSALASNNSRMVLIFDGIRAQNAAIRK